MKKFAIPLLIGLILAAFTFTSCDQPILTYADTWYEFDGITISDQKVTIYVAYSNKGFVTKKQTIDAGLTFIIAAKVGIASGIDVNTYTMKTFGKNETIASTSDGAKQALKANATALDALYLAGRSTSKFTLEDDVTPAPFTENYTKAENLTSIFKNISSWQGLIKELVNTIL